MTIYSSNEVVTKDLTKVRIGSSTVNLCQQTMSMQDTEKNQRRTMNDSELMEEAGDQTGVQTKENSMRSNIGQGHAPNGHEGMDLDNEEDPTDDTQTTTQVQDKSKDTENRLKTPTRRMSGTSFNVSQDTDRGERESRKKDPPAVAVMNSQIKEILWKMAPPMEDDQSTYRSMKLTAVFSLGQSPKQLWNPMAAMKFIYEAMLEAEVIGDIGPISYDMQREATGALPALKSIEDLPMDQPTFEKYFKISRPAPNKNEMHISFEASMKGSLYAIKAKNPNLLARLKEVDCYLEDTDGAKMTYIGFITHRAAKRTSKDGYAEYVRGLCTEYCRHIDIHLLPPWEQQELKHYISDPDHAIPRMTIQTRLLPYTQKAPENNRYKGQIHTLRIRVPRDDVSKMSLLLSKITSIDVFLMGKFVPNNIWYDPKVAPADKWEIMTSHSTFEDSIEVISMFHMNPKVLYEKNDVTSSASLIQDMTRTRRLPPDQTIIHTVEFTMESYGDKARMIVLANANKIHEAVEYLDTVFLQAYKHTDEYHRMDPSDPRKDPIRGRTSADRHHYTSLLRSEGSYSTTDNSSIRTRSTRSSRKTPDVIEIDWGKPNDFPKGLAKSIKPAKAKQKSTRNTTKQQSEKSQWRNQDADSTTTEGTDNTNRKTVSQSTDNDTLSTLEGRSMSNTIETMVSQQLVVFENRISQQQQQQHNEQTAHKLTAFEQQIQQHIRESKQAERAAREAQEQDIKAAREAQAQSSREYVITDPVVHGIPPARIPTTTTKSSKVSQHNDHHRRRNKRHHKR